MNWNYTTLKTGFNVIVNPLRMPPNACDRVQEHNTRIDVAQYQESFFGSGLGQIVMVLWPFVHIVALISISYLTNRPNPYGESIIQYGAVSVLPLIVFNYVARWIVFSAMTNRKFLQCPIIKPLEIVVGRALLEIVSIAIDRILLLLTVALVGYSIMPTDKKGAIEDVVATLFMSVSFGILNAPFAFIMPLWNLVITFIIILSYISSGIVFLPTSLRIYNFISALTRS